MRRLVLSSTVLALLAAAPADAATVRIHEQPGKVRFETEAGEINQVTVAELPGAKLQVIDTGGAPLAAGDGCTRVSATEATCPLDGVRDVKLDLGDQPDTVTVATPFGVSVRGGDGNDTLLGGDGEDDLRGGGGDDRITGGPARDSADGGDGNDDLVSEYSAGDADVFTGGPGNDTLRGGIGNDKLDPSGIADEFAGNDSFDGGVGADQCRSDPNDSPGPSNCEILTPTGGF